MSVTTSFLTFVLEQLDLMSNITSKRMFGGVGIYSGEVFFALIDNDTLYFKVNDETRPAYVKKRMKPFVPDPRKPESAMNGYYAVPVSVLEDRDELAVWAARAIAVGAASVRAKRDRRRDAGRPPRRKPTRQQH
ncbi:MAG TPA: TfoX/Sxy family protein [Vicinamibacterales bacterium]|nr:TfoX/Sxy family protein [Vicinamibacterales bacterium]